MAVVLALDTVSGARWRCIGPVSGPMTNSPHVVVAGTRRVWSPEQKRAILAEADDPATTASEVARRHGLHSACCSDGGAPCWPSSRPRLPHRPSSRSPCRPGHDGSRRAGRAGPDRDRAVWRAPGAGRIRGGPDAPAGRDRRAAGSMIPVPSGSRVWLATGTPTCARASTGWPPSSRTIWRAIRSRARPSCSAGGRAT